MNFFGGPCITRVAAPGKKVFLTFDDGPNATFTPRLLELCAEQGFSATFFLVAERARRFPELARALAGGGHTLGNHSLDHRYGPFFHRAPYLRSWIERAQGELTDITGKPPIAFRSPAGVRTPELSAAVEACGLPLVHWNRRFYDAVLPWTEAKAARAAARAEAGDILLLHDVPHRHPDTFLRALSLLVRELRERGLEPAALQTKDLKS